VPVAAHQQSESSKSTRQARFAAEQSLRRSVQLRGASSRRAGS